MKIRSFLKVLFYGLITFIGIDNFFSLGISNASNSDIESLYILLIFWEVNELRFEFDQWIDAINRRSKKEK